LSEAMKLDFMLGLLACFFFFLFVSRLSVKMTKIFIAKHPSRISVSIIDDLIPKYFCYRKAKIYRTTEEDFRLQFTMKAFLRFFAFNSIAVFARNLLHYLNNIHVGGFRKLSYILQLQFTYNQF
jgi:hypothetical protein